MKNNTLLSKILIFIIGVVVGAFGLLLLKKISSFYINNELDFVAISSTVATLVIALFIGVYYESNRKKNDQRKEKIIGYYEEYLEDLRIKVDQAKKDSTTLQVRSSIFQQLRTRAHALKELTCTKKLLKNNDQNLGDLENELKSLWQKLTEKVQVDDSSTTKDTSTDDTSEPKKEENRYATIQTDAALIRIETIIHRIIIDLNDA